MGNHPEGGDEQYIQLVRVARCAGAGEECGWGVMGPGIETRCHQEYLDHKLVALSEWGGARHRHVHLPLLLHLLDEADHVQAQIVEAETYDDSLMWKATKGSYSCHCVTCCAVLYAINF